jgi:antitoxin (DNA-binding transcriptional repressor) of toxin-antitoxin stability system
MFTCTGRKHLHEVATGSYFTRMRAVGIKLLKNKLSEYVKLAAGGETILVTDRDRVVAELVPPQARPDPMMSNEWYADAVRKGHITPAAVRNAGPPMRAPASARQSLDSLLRELDEDRADR